MRALVRQMGLADFLDVNIPLGKLMSQIQVIKRLLAQAGVTDMLDVDLNKASLARAMGELKNLSETIPVNFDVSQMPVMGPVGPITEKVNIEADTTQAAAAIAGLQARLAVLGDTLTDLRVGLNDAGAMAKIAALQAKLAVLVKTTGAIELTADTSQLDASIAREQAKLAALVQKASDLQIDADTAGAVAKIAALQKQVASLNAGLEDLTAEVDIEAALTRIYALEAQLKVLTSDPETIRIAANITAGLAAITALQSKIAALQAQSDSLKLGFDPASIASAEAKLFALEAAVAKIPVRIPVEFDISNLPVMGAVAPLTEKVSIDTAGAVASLAKLVGATAASQAALAGLDSSGGDTTSVLQNLAAVTAIYDLSAMKFAAETTAMGASADGTKTSILGMSAGAALASMSMTKLIGTFRETAGITGWAGIIHGIFMLSMEFLAVAVPALIAFGAAADDQLQGWADMYTRMAAINVVGQSIGQTFGKTDGQILGLGDALQIAQNAAQPMVYEVLGAAINVMSGNIAGATDKTGKFAAGFNTMGMSVTKSLDQFAAKVDVDLGSSTEQYIGLINKGSADLVEFGEILGNLGHAILNFASDMPGLAEVVLRVITGITGLVLWLSKLPPMLITVVMAIEEAYRWSGYLAAVFGLIGSGIALLGSLGLPILASIGANIAKMFASIVTGAAGAILNLGMIGEKLPVIGDDVASAALSMSTGLEGVAAFLTGPWGIAIGLAIGGAVALVLVMRSFHSATDDWVASLNSVVQKSVGLAQIGATYGALQQTTKALSTVQGNFNTVLAAGGYSYMSLTEAAGRYSGSISTLSGASRSLASDFATEGSNVAFLARTYGVTYTEAAILAGNANANLTQTMKGNTAAAQQNLQMVKNYVAGMGGMGPISGALGADINAVTVDTALQGTEIQKLTTAWTNVMAMVQAPSAGFIGLANSLLQFNTDAKASGATITGLGGAVSGTAKKVTNASLQLQTDFNSAATAAQVMINSLYVTAAVTGSNSLLVQGIRDTIAVLIPLAGTNKSAAAQIHVLAQEAGLGGDSMGQLKKAVDGTKDPLTNLYSISGKAAGQLADLGQDAQNLADTVQTALNQTLVTAAQSLTGVSAKTATYLQDLQNLGSASPVTQAALAGLNSAVSSSNVLAGQAASGISALTGNVSSEGKATAGQQANRQTLYNDINNITKVVPGAAKLIGNLITAVQDQGTGSSKYHADRQTLYDDLVALNIPGPVATKMLDALTTAAQKTGTEADNLAGQHLAPLGAGIDTLKGKTENMAQYFLTNGIPALNDTGGAALTNAGKVKILMDQLQDLPKSVTTDVNVHASGSGGMSFTEKVAQSISTGDFALGVSTNAAGRKITEGTGPTADDVLVRVSRGETIVSAADSRRLAGAFAAVGVPGYASGGIPAIVPWTQSAEAGFAQAAETNFVDSVEASLKAMVKAAAEAKAASGGGSIVSYAESFLGKIPYVWGGTSLSTGADCSGFTQAVYSRFGINAPRTSEAQGAWVKKGAPTPGGLAFYVSSAGGPPPGHVAIVASGSSAVSQGGGMGPQMMGLHALPLMFTGTPPGGFPGDAAGTAPAGVKGLYDIAQLEQLWDAAGGKPGAAYNMARIAIAESGGNPSAYNASGATGLWQILGSVVPGNLDNPMVNAENAVAKYNESGYLPWSSDPVASALIASGLDYAQGGLVGQSSPNGYATGGVPAATTAMMTQLAKQQVPEIRDYLGLTQAFQAGLADPAKGSWLAANKNTVKSGLAALTKDQQAEQAAYAALGHGVTGPRETALLTQSLKEAAFLKGNKDLSHLPGGHPGWVRGLETWLSRVSLAARAGAGTTASGAGATRTGSGGSTVPAGSGPTAGFAAAAADVAKRKAALAQQKTMLAQLAAEQGSEVRDWAGLNTAFSTGIKHAAKGSWLAAHAADIRHDLSESAKDQAAELAAYKTAKTGTGGAALAGKARDEAGWLGSESRLSHTPGGHPGLVSGLKSKLAAISTTAGALPSGTALAMATGLPGAFEQYLLGGSGKFVVSLPGLQEVTYSGGSAAGVTGPSAMAAGGKVMSYDQGGWLPPGTSLAYNGTGRSEPVGAAAAAQKIEVTLSFDDSALLQLSPQQIRAIKYEVRKHGGSAQKAFGSPTVR